MWLERTFNTLGIGGENPALVSVVRPRSLDYLRVIFGLILLYDAWTSLSFTHKTEMSGFLGLSMDSAWLHLTVAMLSFLKLALAASVLSEQGIPVMGWVGAAYGLFVWLAVEHGGDFGESATDPGFGLPYVVLFLYLLGATRLKRDPDRSRNSLLAAARVVFGLLWAYDAILKFQPHFLGHYLDYLSEAEKGQSGWILAYDQAWVALSQAVGPTLIAWMVALLEAALAIGLVSGRGLRIVGPLGLGLSFVIWSTAEQWGGPYSLGVSTMMPMSLLGVAVLYMLALGYVWVLYNPLDLFAPRSDANSMGEQPSSADLTN